MKTPTQSTLEALKKGDRAAVKQVEQVRLAYQQVFLHSEEGRLVLEHLCNMAGFYEEIKDPAQMVRMNFVVEILRLCGLNTMQRNAKIVKELYELSRK